MINTNTTIDDLPLFSKGITPWNLLCTNKLARVKLYNPFSTNHREIVAYSSLGV
jgi:hypothetical protein